MTTETKQHPVKRGEITTLTSILEAHDSGGTVADISAAIRSALGQGADIANEHGTATTKCNLTITLVQAGNGRVELKVEGKVQAPREPHPTTILHSAEQGTLTARDPRQVEMPFRTKRRGDDDGNSNSGGN